MTKRVLFGILGLVVLVGSCMASLALLALWSVVKFALRYALM